MIKAREALVDILIEAGIEYVFGMPGGATVAIFDALYDRQDEIRTILARHESGAACMADMYGRITGKPGVVLGQGAWIGSNAAFGIMEAYLAGSPMLVIADLSDYSGLIQHAPYQCMGGEYGSVNLPNIMRSMTKYTTVATTGEELLHGAQFAIKHAVTGRPGPACLLFRMNVAAARFESEKAAPRIHPTSGYLNTSPPAISQADAERVAELILEARDPVMIAGRGVHCARAYEEIQELAELVGMPVATSYMGKSTIAETHELALGTMGDIGQRVANEKIRRADFLLAVGTCLAPDNTRMLSPEFIDPERQRIVQIDIEPRNAGWIFPVTLGITSDAKLALRGIIQAIKGKSIKINVEGIESLKRLKAELGFFTGDAMESPASPVEPERIVRDLNETMGPDDLLVLDAGNNRMWFANLFRSKKAGQVIAPGGAAGIGWGVPAALAAQLAQPGRKVVCGCGDGGMMQMLYAFEMARDYRLPLTYVVMNNGCLGNVMDFQRPERRIASEYDRADFAAIGRAMGCEGFRIEKPEELRPALGEAIQMDRPAVVDVVTSKSSHMVLRQRAG